LNSSGARAPFGIPRDLAVIAIAMFIWGLGEGLFIFFYPLSLQHWGLNPVQIGVVLSLIGVIMAVVQVPAGYLSDRFGSRPLIRVASILGVLCALVMGFSQSRPVFVAGLMAYSLTSFIVAPLNSYITSVRGSWSVQRALTFVSAFMMAGGIAGPILGGWIAETAGFSIVFRYSAGLFLISTVVIFFAKHPVMQDQQTPPVHRLVSPLANPRFIGLLVIIFFTIFALNIPTQLASLYLQNVQHLSIQQIGMTGTIASIGTAVLMFSLGNLGAHAGMLAGQLVVAAFSLIMWRGQNVAVFFAGYLFAGGSRLYRSMSLAFARPLVKARDIGLAYGMVETGNALAIILAPLGAGFLYTYKPEAVFTVGLVAIAITILLNLLLSHEKRQSIKNL
jgi:DHA1 family multidrug resistance protein-like MFS transporter